MSDGSTATAAARWGKVIDHTVCIGCHACSTACKSENAVPLSVNRTYVKYVDVGTFPHARRAFQVTRCNQCEEPPCAIACPTHAMYQRADGIVDFDKRICIGCKACIAACPYDAIFINPEDGAAEKCNLCAHRLEVGLEPACVVVCPTEAILVGDLNDQGSRVAQLVQRHPVAVRRPEKETRPKLLYLGTTQATLDPLAAQRPGGGLFLWSEQNSGAGQVVSGHPGPNGSRRDGRAAAGSAGGANSAAAAMLAYDVPHRAPWDWRVSAYTWTKSIASGSWLAAAMAVWLGVSPADDPLWRWQAPALSLLFLALTGALLLADLEHPERFYYIFTRGQRRSWLVRGAWIITGYAGLLLAHLGIGAAAGPVGHPALPAVGMPLALMTAVYTAYLFAQAKARDLWQSPLLPAHMAVQALLAGCAATALLALVTGSPASDALARGLAAASGLHLLLVAGEVTLTHATAHARLAVREMTRGRYAGFFRAGVVLLLGGVAAPWLGVGAPVLALFGLLLYEHAYVQAGQAVPLA